MDRSSRQKINKKTVTLNDTPNQMDLTGIFKAFHTKAAKYTFFSSVHRTFSRIDHMLGHKTSLNTFQKIEIFSMNLVKSFSIQFILSKNKLQVLLIFYVFLDSISAVTNFLAAGTNLMEDNFSPDQSQGSGVGEGTGGRAGVVMQVKLCSLACHSPPAMWAVPKRLWTNGLQLGSFLLYFIFFFLLWSLLFPSFY